MNSSGMAVSMFAAACVAVLVVAAAAHEDHVHTPGMEMPPAPAPSSSTLVSPSVVIGIALAFVASLLGDLGYSFVRVVTRDVVLCCLFIFTNFKAGFNVLTDCKLG
ncbi:hypothetical protein DKX38_013409 [Salix brachista]|uniref:CASP-like protein n=1 Tax=Salix brachista TaxID=2182728 RepID=A0A5N5LR99_9ROSI|nr:hypothetical protein DKX38_013409 [Salix brachista]